MNCKHFVLIAGLLIFACGSKQQSAKTTTSETNTEQSSSGLPDEKDMDHYISGYQNWIDDNDMKEALGFAEVWYDTTYIIVSDSSRKTNPKLTLTIGKKTQEEKTVLSNDKGGMNTRTIYQLESNDEGYDELIIFTNAVSKKILGSYTYTIAFTLSGKKTKSYYCNKEDK